MAGKTTTPKDNDVKSAYIHRLQNNSNNKRNPGIPLIHKTKTKKTFKLKTHNTFKKHPAGWLNVLFTSNKLHLGTFQRFMDTWEFVKTQMFILFIFKPGPITNNNNNNNKKLLMIYFFLNKPFKVISNGTMSTQHFRNRLKIFFTSIHCLRRCRQFFGLFRQCLSVEDYADDDNYELHHAAEHMRKQL